MTLGPSTPGFAILENRILASSSILGVYPSLALANYQLPSLDLLQNHRLRCQLRRLES